MLFYTDNNWVKISNKLIFYFTHKLIIFYYGRFLIYIYILSDYYFNYITIIIIIEVYILFLII